MAVHGHLCHFQVCLKLGKWDKKKKAFNFISDFWGGGRQPIHFSYEYRDIRMEYIYTYEALLVKLSQRFGSLRQHDEMIGSV